MGQSIPISSEWKTGCITKSNIKLRTWCEPVWIGGVVQRYKLSVFTRLKLVESKGCKEKRFFFLILTTSTNASLMAKVGTTSKSDVTQKEKKP